MQIRMVMAYVNAVVVAAAAAATHLVIFAHPAFGKPTTTETLSPFAIYQVQACGKALADLLQNICHKGYNLQHESDEFNDDAGRGVVHSSGGGGDDARKKRAITRECCFQPCAFHDLFQYCYNESSANDSLLRQPGANTSTLELNFYAARTGRDIVTAATAAAAAVPAAATAARRTNIDPSIKSPPDAQLYNTNEILESSAASLKTTKLPPPPQKCGNWSRR